jgi:hypothetical protein
VDKAKPFKILKRIDARHPVVRRKFKRIRHQTNGARDWFDRLRRANPTLFAHWSRVVATAEHGGPCDSIGSRAVLGVGAEIPMEFTSPR